MEKQCHYPVRITRTYDNSKSVSDFGRTLLG